MPGHLRRRAHVQRPAAIRRLRAQADVQADWRPGGTGTRHCTRGRGCRPMSVAAAVDSVMEASIAPSFTRVGYQLRSRLEHWTPLAAYHLTGRTIVVTGATSGLGRQAAEEFAGLGANVVICGRDVAKVRRVRAEIAASTGSSGLTMACADMAELEQVRTMADQLLASHPRIDVLVHNAGALTGHRAVN